MAVLLDGASRLQAKLVPRESIGGEALYVQDPLDAENNVARSCFAFHQVQQVFRDLCEPSPVPTLTLPYNSKPSSTKCPRSSATRSRDSRPRSEWEGPQPQPRCSRSSTCLGGCWIRRQRIDPPARESPALLL